MKEEVNVCVRVKDKWLEARESKWIYSKGRYSLTSFSHAACPVKAGLTGKSHHLRSPWCSLVLKAAARHSRAEPAPQAGPREGLKRRPLHGWSARHPPGRAVPNLSRLYVFSCFVSLVVLPAGQAVPVVKEQRPAGTLRLTSRRQGRRGRAGEGVRLGETLATSSWLPSRAFQLFLYVLLVLCLFGI